MDEVLEMIFDCYRGRCVLVTGHTGFKGSWLCEWLLSLGAEVHGFAQEPPTEPALFDQLGLAKRIASHTIGDIRDRGTLAKAVASVDPDFVFHLAAQPLVRLSYREPVETFDTNVMGTVNLLEAVRQQARTLDERRKTCSVVCITTDKVYENNESGQAYKESDPFGGYDPYSASKGACEIAIASYRRSFFNDPANPVWVASARAGNVIGGGDWALDRIVPDCTLCIRIRIILNGGLCLKHFLDTIAACDRLVDQDDQIGRFNQFHKDLRHVIYKCHYLSLRNMSCIYPFSAKTNN